ncbi:CPBP family intramembrane glutamic endopeptidase [Microbacterium lushaniae]|nr:CPBP family intramembrane glutamic endopeptidase [Microbacterium lushaniae]
MLLVTALLALVSSTPLFRFAPFESDVVNRMLNYQLSALPVAGLALLLTFACAGRIRLGYLNLNRRGEMRPVFGRSGGGRWETDAWFIGSVMVAIVAVVTFFQLLPGGFTFHWVHVALIVPFAVMNAFTEEAIFRLPYVTMGDNDTNSRAYGLVMGSIVFGFIHFWGVAPNGFVGAIMSAALGFFLAKSIQETRGFFWAFMIHFTLNLAGMTFILNRSV